MEHELSSVYVEIMTLLRPDLEAQCLGTDWQIGETHDRASHVRVQDTGARDHTCEDDVADSR